jgi:hypothetical protein
VGWESSDDDGDVNKEDGEEEEDERDEDDGDISLIELSPEHQLGTKMKGGSQYGLTYSVAEPLTVLTESLFKAILIRDKCWGLQQ